MYFRPTAVYPVCCDEVHVCCGAWSVVATPPSPSFNLVRWYQTFLSIQAGTTWALETYLGYSVGYVCYSRRDIWALSSSANGSRSVYYGAGFTLPASSIVFPNILLHLFAAHMILTPLRCFFTSSEMLTGYCGLRMQPCTLLTPVWQVTLLLFTSLPPTNSLLDTLCLAFYWKFSFCVLDKLHQRKLVCVCNLGLCVSAMSYVEGVQVFLCMFQVPACGQYEFCFCVGFERCVFISV